MVGDGDCGSTLRRGAEAIKYDMASRLPLNDAAGMLKGLARTLRVMGGTSGVLYVISLTAAAGELFSCQKEIPPLPKHSSPISHALVTFLDVGRQMWHV